MSDKLPSPSPDACELVGVTSDGTEVPLGTVPMPPRMKAREILASYFGHEFDRSSSDASMALAAVDELLDWMAQQQALLRASTASGSPASDTQAAPDPVSANAPQDAAVWPPASLGKLMSMAIRSNHALAMPGYYDQPLIKAANHGLSHAQVLEAKIREMRQVHEEASGRGFWSQEKDADYRDLAIQLLGNSSLLDEFGDHSGR